MANNIFDFHLLRLKSATLNAHTMETIPEWICENTKLNGDRYSYKDHEYQERILRDTSREVVIRKCAQVGISELSARLSLALCNVISGFTIIYTLPTAKFAGTFMRTRIDPIIDSSPYMSDAVHTTTDNSEVKRFGDSYLYLKGSQSNNAPISTPADMLVSDELDFSDPDVISQYNSRLQHSKYKRKLKLSTPTIPGYGIDYEFSRSRRNFNMVKCNHCNEWFIPDFYKHVRIPNFTGDVKEITKHNIFNFEYRSAYVECPKCGKAPSLQVEHRQWVCENPEENYTASGYQVTPFDAPNIVTPADLIEGRTQYRKTTDFDNFALGMPAEDKESTITREELVNSLVRGVDGAASYVMGLDMGMECHCVIMAVTELQLIVVHTEVIPAGQVRKRRRELAHQFHVRMTVVDSLPYTETVLHMQAEDPNLYASVYVETKMVETHSVKQREDRESSGHDDVRQVNVNRNKTFDAYMDMIRCGDLLKVSDQNDELWMTHHQSMRRVRTYTADNEMAYAWRKAPDGEDHFHHGGAYAFIASRILGVSRPLIMIPFSIGSFRVKSDEEKAAERRGEQRFGFSRSGY